LKDKRLLRQVVWLIRSHNCQQGKIHLRYNLPAFLFSLFGKLCWTVGHKKRNPQTNRQSELLARTRKNNGKGSPEHSPKVSGNRSYCSHPLQSFACPAEGDHSATKESTWRATPSGLRVQLHHHAEVTPHFAETCHQLSPQGPLLRSNSFCLV